MINKRSFFAAALALGTAVAVASPALAASATSPGGGAVVTSTGKTMKVKDAQGDGHWVYGYANTKSNRLDNKSGYGTTVEKTYGAAVALVMACTERPLATDARSDWKS